MRGQCEKYSDRHENVMMRAGDGLLDSIGKYLPGLWEDLDVTAKVAILKPVTKIKKTGKCLSRAVGKEELGSSGCLSARHAYAVWICCHLFNAC